MTDQPSAPSWRLAEIEPAGADLLALLATLGVTPLPVKVLTEHRGALSAPLAAALDDEPAHDHLEDLVPSGAVTVRGDRISLTKTARDEVRQTLTARVKARSARTAVELLLASFTDRPEQPEEWDGADALVEHVLSVTGEIDGTITDGGEVAAAVGAGAVTLLDRVGRYFLGRGRYKAAWGVLDHAVALCARVGAPAAALEGALLRSLARASFELGEFPVALRRFGEALRVHSHDQEMLQAARDLIGLASVLEALSRPDAALRQIDNALELLTGEAASTAPSAAAVEHATALLVKGWIRAAGDAEAGIAIIERALAELTGLHDPEARLRAVMARGQLGVALGFAGRSGEGRALIEEALRDSEELYGPDHPEIGVLLSNLGPLCAHAGALPEAREHLERSVASAERLLPNAHPARCWRHGKLAVVLEQLGEHQAALAHRRQAATLAESLYGSHKETAAAMLALGKLELRLGDHRAAASACVRAIHIGEAIAWDGRMLSDARWTLVQARVAGDDLPAALSALQALIDDVQDDANPAAALPFELAAAELVHRLGQAVAKGMGSLGARRSASAVDRQLKRTILGLVDRAIVADSVPVVLRGCSLATAMGALDQARRGLERVEALPHEAREGYESELFRQWGELVDALEAQGETDGVIATLEHVVGSDAIDERSRAAALLRLSVNTYARQPDAAFSAVDRASAAFQRVDNYVGWITAERWRAIMQQRAGDGAAAIATLEALLPEAGAEQETLPEPLVLAMLDFQELVARAGDRDRALDLGRRALTAARQQDNQELLSSALLTLGRALEARHDLPEALEAYRERRSLVVAAPRRDHYAEAVALHDLGDVYGGLQQLDEAVEAYGQAASHWRRLGASRALATTLRALSRGYRARGETELAAVTAQELVVVLDALPDVGLDTKIDAVLLLASIESERSHDDDAYLAAQGAVTLAEQLDDPEWLRLSLARASMIALEAWRGADAVRLAEAAVAAASAGKASMTEVLFTHLQLARAQHQSSPPEAFETILRTVEMIRATEDHDVLAGIGGAVNDFCVATRRLEAERHGSSSCRQELGRQARSWGGDADRGARGGPRRGRPAHAQGPATPIGCPRAARRLAGTGPSPAS